MAARPARGRAVRPRGRPGARQPGRPVDLRRRGRCAAPAPDRPAGARARAGLRRAPADRRRRVPRADRGPTRRGARRPDRGAVRGGRRPTPAPCAAWAWPTGSTRPPSTPCPRARCSTWRPPPWPGAPSSPPTGSPTLTGAPPDPAAHLVSAPDGTVLVVEQGTARPVRSGLLLPALESVLGERRPISAEDLDGLREGPPVELLEGRSGSPFVVVGGRRLPVAGLPLPHPVERSPLDGLPEGPAIDASAAVVPRRANLASAWLPGLTPAGTGGSRPEVVARPDGALFLFEGGLARRISSGLLAPALEERLGPRRAATEEELAAWQDGPPLELLEGPAGPPYLVIGGTRVPVLNLPMPHPLRTSALDGLPEGPPIDVTAVQRAALTSGARGRRPARPTRPDRRAEGAGRPEGRGAGGRAPHQAQVLTVTPRGGAAEAGRSGTAGRAGADEAATPVSPGRRSRLPATGSARPGSGSRPPGRRRRLR